MLKTVTTIARTTAETAQNRLDTTANAIIDRLSIQQAKATLSGFTTLTTFAVPAAAQSVQEVGSAMCQSGVGQLVGFVFIGGAMYFLGKSVFVTMQAMDKMNSTNQQKAMEGKEKIKSAGTTAGAAFVPAIAAGVFEIVGINTVTCLSPGSWSVIGYATIPLF